MKLGIVVGHNSRAQGANAVAPISASEFEFNSALAEIMDSMAPQFGMDAKIFKRRHQGSFSREIREVYAATDAFGAGATIELHFNAFNRRARGTETLSSTSGRSMRMANAVQNLVADLYERNGVTDRGVKTRRRTDRGGLSLHVGRAPAILVEPFFGDSGRECEMVQRVGQEALAQAYLKGIAEAFSLMSEQDIDPDEIGPTGEAADFAHFN